MRFSKSIASIIFLLFITKTAAQNSWSTLKSEILQKDIQVYVLKELADSNSTDIIYITDGKKFVDNGGLRKIKELTEKEKIPRAYYVFVSTIDKKTGQDFRNRYFFNNPDYLKFFEKELVPKFEGDIGRRFVPNNRVLLGISFGGLNAAYFSSRTKLFKKYALLSPITYPKREELMKELAFSKLEDLRVYISTGTLDAETYAKELHKMYKSKKYRLKCIQTGGGHDFKNWNNQLEDIFGYLVE